MTDLESDAAPGPDSQGGRWLRRRHAGGVAIVTVVGDGAYRGSTLSAWMVVSIEPLQLLIALEEESQIGGWIEDSASFVLNVMPWREQFHADQFAGFTPRASPSFAGIDHHIGVTGAPILTHSIAWAECTVQSAMEIGDHQCVVGQIVALGSGNGDDDDPLVYYLNRYRRFESR